MFTIDNLADAFLYDAEFFFARGKYDMEIQHNLKQFTAVNAFGWEEYATDEADSWFCLLVREALMEIEETREALLLDAMWWFNPLIVQNSVPNHLAMAGLGTEWGWEYAEGRITEMWFSLLIREAINPL